MHLILQKSLPGRLYIWVIHFLPQKMISLFISYGELPLHLKHITCKATAIWERLERNLFSHLFSNQDYLTLDVKLKPLLQIETNRRNVELLLKGTALTSSLAECCIWRILDISSAVKEVRQFKRRLLACLLLRNSFCYYDEVRRIYHT